MHGHWYVHSLIPRLYSIHYYWVWKMWFGNEIMLQCCGEPSTIVDMNVTCTLWYTSTLQYIAIYYTTQLCKPWQYNAWSNYILMLCIANNWILNNVSSMIKNSYIPQMEQHEPLEATAILYSSDGAAWALAGYCYSVFPRWSSIWTQKANAVLSGECNLFTAL